MTYALALFLLALAVPAFFGRIRSAPAWLLVQALALAWAGLMQHPQVSVHTLAALAEVVVMRALVAPWLLRRALRLRGGPNFDLMPSNLFTWAAAMALIVLAFEFGAAAAAPDDHHAMALGAVAAAVAMCLLLLATNAEPPAQLVAVLYMENALGLFETLLPQPWPVPVHVALGLLYLGTVAVGAWLIGAPEPAPAAAQPAGSGGT